MKLFKYDLGIFAFLKSNFSLICVFTKKTSILTLSFRAKKVNKLDKELGPVNQYIGSLWYDLIDYI